MYRKWFCENYLKPKRSTCPLWLPPKSATGDCPASGGPRLALRGSGDATEPGVHDRDRRFLSGSKSVLLVSPLDV